MINHANLPAVILKTMLCVILLNGVFGDRALLAEELPEPGERLSEKQVSAFTKLAMANIRREYPNKLSHVWSGDEPGMRPRDLHPVFYGSFDWHSCVHAHWMLVRLLKLYPQADESDAVRKLLEEQFTAEKLRLEAEYYDGELNGSYERMYGWAWALKLVQELRAWDDEQAQRWAENFQPLERKLAESVSGYLPRLTYPVRAGVHRDTAFALYMILDYARTVRNKKLEAVIVGYARDKYAGDTDYPFDYEPSGQDFFSAGLNEADLMRRVLEPAEYSRWLERFMPKLVESGSNILEPAVVSDLSDPKIVHLVGLNLSRAWTQRGIASVLPKEDPRRKVLEESARVHCRAGMTYVFSGHYEGEHWLASFAVYLLTDAGIQ